MYPEDAQFLKTALTADMSTEEGKAQVAEAAFDMYQGSVDRYQNLLQEEIAGLREKAELLREAIVLLHWVHRYMEDTQFLTQTQEYRDIHEFLTRLGEV